MRAKTTKYGNIIAITSAISPFEQDIAARGKRDTMEITNSPSVHSKREWAVRFSNTVADTAQCADGVFPALVVIMRLASREHKKN